MNGNGPGSLTLATAAAGSVVFAADPFAQSAGPDYWDWSQDSHRGVVSALLGLGDPEISALVSRLSNDPADADAFRRLVTGIVEHVRPADGKPTPLAEIVWEMETISRLRYHLGGGWRAEKQAPTAEELLANLRSEPHGHRGHVDAAVVIPFRAREDSPRRVRNLAAVLAALNDQSHPRDRYRVIVAEADDRPRWRDLFAPACDSYLFAHGPGRFNKSWAFNVGVVNAGRPADVVCVLDADMLVDRDFIERAVERFAHPGTQAHWPYEDMLCLDDSSSGASAYRRCIAGEARTDLDLVRGVALRRSPGACFWLRESLFTRVGGMDERFAGWGGEDMDFVWRVERYGTVDRYADPIVHLYHERSPYRAEDGTGFFEAINFCSWPTDSVIGELDKYADTAT